MPQCKADLSSVEAGSLLCKALMWLCLQMTKELSALAVLEDVIEFFVSLEGCKQHYDERTLPLLGCNTDISLDLSPLLCMRISSIAAINQYSLLHCLHCVELAVALILHKLHLSEAALSQDSQDLKVLSANCILVERLAEKAAVTFFASSSSQPNGKRPSFRYCGSQEAWQSRVLAALSGAAACDARQHHHHGHLSAGFAILRLPCNSYLKGWRKR
mmetsp:Transcript_77306/g.125141  ORF Transcript_77306/g.125141 Transcript_77306/m.125141 type:complete len:216 (+) Transcript_77306:805-1452(+)